MKKYQKVLLIILINLCVSSTLLLTFMVLIIAPQVLLKGTALNSTESSNGNYSTLNGTNSSFAIDLDSSQDKLKLGFFFGIKGVIQAIISPPIGILIDKTCPLVGMLSGAVADLVAILIYISTESFVPFFIARILNGIGSTCSACGAFSAIPYYFLKDDHRKKINGALRVVMYTSICTSPLLGGAVNQYFGQVLAFTMISPMQLIIIIISLPMLINFFRRKLCSKEQKLEVINSSNPAQQILEVEVLSSSSLLKEEDDVNISPAVETKMKTPFYKLLIDPYIIISVIGLNLSYWGNMAINVTLPLYMQTKFQSQQYQQGLVFVSGIGFHILGSLMALFIFKRWSKYSYIFIIITLMINAISTFSLIFIEVWYLLTIPVGLTYFSIAMLEYSLFPFMITLVDKRHNSNYGSVTSLYVFTNSIGTGLIAFISGPFVVKLGFSYFILFISCVYLCFSPLFLFTHKYWQ